MCGILGTVNKPFDRDIFSLIAHRGPDDSDIVTYKAKNNNIYLGHVRLSIVDLSEAGHQPMESACGQFVIIFNGEIYNHLELRKRLPNIEFKGHSDTETIVNYIARFGIEAVKDFNGIFAFVIYDKKSQKIYTVRDRYGVKPVYYHYSNDGDRTLIFSSEIRPIKDLIGVRKVNKDNLATLLKLRYNPSPLTIYEGIEKLRPGHIIEYDIVLREKKIYSFILPIKINKKQSLEKSIEVYGSLFEKAVKRQLMSDVEVGVLLSGGIDSALVAYYAQKHRDKPIKTFTVGFLEDDDSDESLDAQETAKILGTQHYEVKISKEEFENGFSECINIVEEPLGTTSIIPMYYLNKLVASKGVKVVLTGQGADEPLGGYKRYLGEKMHGQIPIFLFKIIKFFSFMIKNEAVYRAVNSLGEKDTVKRWELIYSLFSDNEIQKLINSKDYKSKELISYFYDLLVGETKDSLSAMMSNDIRMNLCDDLLVYTDKISMNFSIESRVPLLDNDLVDFIESLPLEYKIKGKEGKYIHKKFAEKVLPKEIIYRKKKGFKSPTEKWFKGEKGLTYKDKLVNGEGLFCKLFNLKEVNRIFDIHLSGRKNMEKQLFTLISIYFLLN